MGPVTIVSDAVFDAPSGRAEVKRAKVDLAASGDLVAAVPGKRIRVLALFVCLATANTIKLQSGGSTDLTGAMTGTQFNLGYNPHGWVQTAAGEKLNLVEGSGVQASGTVVYAEVTA